MAIIIIENATLPGGWKVGFREIRETVENQEKRINDQDAIIAQQRKIIDDLVIFSMAWFLFDLLKGIYYAQKNNGKYLFDKNGNNIDNLIFLRNNGYIDLHGVRQLEHGVNLGKIVKLTPIGNYYVELREKREKEVKNELGA